MQIPSIVPLFQDSSNALIKDIQIATVLTIALFIPLIAGIVLWNISNWLAKLITAGLPNNGNTNNSLPHIQTMAITTVGLVVVVLSLPYLISLAVQFFVSYSSILDTDKTFKTVLLANIAASITKVVLGLTLVLGASGWVKLLYKIRGFGLK